MDSIGIAELSAALRSAYASAPDGQPGKAAADGRETASIDALLQAADAALYRAKDGGKNRCVTAERA